MHLNNIALLAIYRYNKKTFKQLKSQKSLFLTIYGPLFKKWISLYII